MPSNDVARSALFKLDPGCPREQWLQLAMAAKGAGLSLDDFTEWSEPASNFHSARDCATVWRSVRPGSITAGTLYHLAELAGWKHPGRTPQPRHSPPNRRARDHHADQAPQSQQTPAYAAGVSPADMWQRCEPATDAHPYIIAKRGNADGLRVVRADDGLRVSGNSVAGWLAVPATSLDGTMRTVQLIPRTGTGAKMNLRGASFGDGMFIVGSIAESARVFICEGIGQAWACWRATACAAVVTFGAGRIATVARALRNAHSALPLVLVPDRGQEINAETIALAVRGSWVAMPQDKASNYDASDYAAEHDDDALADLLNHPTTPAMRYRLLAADAVAKAPPLGWLVRGVLPATGLACIFGASGSGKSFLALDLCAAVAEGVRWFDCKVMAAPVVYVALEGEAGFGQRVRAWELHRARPMPDKLRFVMQPFGLLANEDVTALADAVQASGCAGGLLVLDTLNRAASGADENTSADMGAIIDGAKALQTRCGGLVLLVHHSGKDASRGLRGHSSLIAALDTSIEVTKTDAGQAWKLDKSKDGRDGITRTFALLAVEIGKHFDGESIASCVVVRDDGPRDVKRALPPKSGNQRIAWDATSQLLRSAPKDRPTDAPESLPQGKPAVPLEAALDAIRRRLTCDQKRRAERAIAALTGLQARRLVMVDSEFVWIP